MANYTSVFGYFKNQGSTSQKKDTRQREGIIEIRLNGNAEFFDLFQEILNHSLKKPQKPKQSIQLVIIIDNNLCIN